VARIRPGEEIPAEVEALVVDLHAYKNLVQLATAYRLFNKKVIFVAATPDEELGLLEFIDPSDDIVRVDALEAQLAIRVERLLSAPYMTRMDALTGLSNRRFAFDVAARAIKEGVDTEHPLSIILVDIDEFKRINDQYGHATGDSVLKALGIALASASAGALCVARIGGDEFLVLLSADRDLVRARAEALRAAIQAIVVEGEIRITASLGVATAISSPSGFEELVSQADICMYHAKQLGKNRVVDQADFGSYAQSRDEEPAIIDFDNRVRVLTDRLAEYLSQKGRILARGFQDEAELDGLTGIFNRRYFDRRILREFELAHRPDRPLSLLFFDIDDFGAVNRDYGYPAGDRCLKAVTAAIARSVRSTDWVARYGGEELCAILPDTPLDEAAAIAERILETIRAIEATTVDGRKFKVTASCGVVETRGRDAEVPEFVQRASDKVREAKKAGKDRAVR
jgi:diguanylate cyclase (GGDEF)-like protein